LEHSASEPMLAGRVGNPAKYGKAQKMDNPAGYDGCVQTQAGRLIRGSPALSCVDARSDWLARFIPIEQVIPSNRKRERGAKRCRVADESVVVINPRPVKAGNGLEDKTGETLCLS